MSENDRYVRKRRKFLKSTDLSDFDTTSRNNIYGQQVMHTNTPWCGKCKITSGEDYNKRREETGNRGERSSFGLIKGMEAP